MASLNCIKFGDFPPCNINFGIEVLEDPSEDVKEEAVEVVPEVLEDFLEDMFF
jgi:hypothetical protein